MHQRLWLNNKGTVKKNKEQCIEMGKQYYEDNKERLPKMAHDWYQALSKEEKNKETMLEINIRVCLKKRKSKRIWKTTHKKYI